MEEFQKDQEVCWKKGDRFFQGKVFAVIPANKSPRDCIDMTIFRDVNLKPLGLIATLQPRKEVSYLVEVRVGERGIRAIYWPSTAALERA